MYKNLKPNSIFEIKLDIPSKIPPKIIDQIKPVQYLEHHYYYFRVRLDKVKCRSTFKLLNQNFLKIWNSFLLMNQLMDM